MRKGASAAFSTPLHSRDDVANEWRNVSDANAGLQSAKTTADILHNLQRRAEAQGVLEAYDARRAATAIASYVKGLGTNSVALFNDLEERLGVKLPSGKLLKEAYLKDHKETLEDALRGDLSGNDLQRALSAVRKAEQRPNEELLRAPTRTSE